MRIRAVLLVLVFAGARGADTPVNHEISLMTGRGELLQFDRDVLRVAISEPKIADALVVSPHDVMVSAKSPGHTTLVIWETDAPPARYEIAVSSDTMEQDALLNSLGTE